VVGLKVRDEQSPGTGDLDVPRPDERELVHWRVVIDGVDTPRERESPHARSAKGVSDVLLRRHSR
jgi:hypothetical protein